MRIFTYVIATDAGSAPNYGPPCLTLAICKPMIRRTAEPGDAVLAFNGSSLGANPNGVRWAGVISEALSFTEYWRDARFAGKRPDASSRPDNIYAPDGLDFRQVPNPVHGPGSKARDLGGRFVLIFEQWWYFGNSAPVLPGDFGLWMPLRARRGHRQRDLSGADWLALRHWLDDQKQAVPSVAWNTPGPKRQPGAIRGSC